MFRNILVFFSVLVVISCHKDKTRIESSCGIMISYSSDVVPIIQNSCMTGSGSGTGCHDTWITEYENIVNYIENESWQNEIWGSYSMPKMPNSYGIDSLTTGEIEIMKCWIEQGYPEN